MDDAALVQRAADGDMVAFGAIYDRYAGRLHDFFWWVLRDAELANEALHEAFLEAGSRIGDLRDPGRLRPWLFAIAGQEALRYRAPRKGESAPVAPPTGDAAWDGLVARLGDVIDGLSPRDRVLLHFRYRQNLDGLDLADAIGSKPDDAALLVDSLGQRVERQIGATAVAYFGRERCPAVADIVGDADEIDAKTREKVAVHAEMCQICADLRRRRIGPQALIALSPPPPLAETERGRVLEEVDLATHSGRDWPARRLGFPPPLIGGHGHRWRFIVAAVLIVLLGVGAFVLNRNGKSTDVASVGTTVVPSSTSSLRPTSSTSSTSSTSTSTTVPPGPDVVGAPGSTTPRATGAGSGGGGGTTGGGGGGGGTEGGGGGGTTTPPATDPPSSNTTAPATTAPPATTPPDDTPPTMTGLSATATCAASGVTINISVQASDASGVASVSALVLSTRVNLSNAGGNTYTGSVTLPATTPVIPVVVTATDSRGNPRVATTNVSPNC